MIKRIILDTSSILFALSIKKDAFEAAREQYPDYDIVLSRGIIKELKKLAATKKKEGRDARTALLMLPRKRFILNRNEGYVDKWILKEAEATGALVCTNDTRLRKALKAEGRSAFAIGMGGQFR